jgi:competence ComEA-like helix-hairpin-helix protein
MRIIGLKSIVGLFLVLSLLFALNVMTVCAEDPLSGKTVNVNTATAEEFAKNVPLIDMELAERIVEYREEAGEFQVIEELLQVEGFTRSLLRKVKNYLLLEGIGGDECTC